MKLRVTLDGETSDVLVEKLEEPPLPKDIVVAITAAVSSVLEGRPFRIRHIHQASPSAPWAQAGRQQIQISHNLERNNR
jgi:hypothetical protein